ncbi:MAG: hypothetical protein HYX76_12340 [Acidobacteria bacterium]|nr:hypothetical protein [Acidobacteriota bacterium]
MNRTRPKLQLRLEHFTRGLTRELAHEGTQLIVHARIDLVGRLCANTLPFSSPPRQS